MRFISLFAIVLGFFASAPASAVKLSLVGALNMSEPKSAGTTYTAKNAFGGGAMLEFGLGPVFGFELGALSVPRKYEYASSTGASMATVVATQKMLQVPVLFRAYLGSLLSLGVGGYYSKFNGNYETETTTLGVRINTSRTYASAGYTDSDYGFVSSLGIYMPLAPLFRLYFDGRYTVGIKDNSVDPNTEFKFNDIQALAGFQIGF